jgi:hypothetical protein
MNESQGLARHARGNRTIVDAFRAERDEADQDRKDEQQLDESRGLWGPIE